VTGCGTGSAGDDRESTREHGQQQQEAAAEEAEEAAAAAEEEEPGAEALLRTARANAQTRTGGRLGAALGYLGSSSALPVLDCCMRPTLASSEADASTPTNARKGRPCARAADDGERAARLSRCMRARAPTRAEAGWHARGGSSARGGRGGHETILSDGLRPKAPGRMRPLPGVPEPSSRVVEDYEKPRYEPGRIHELSGHTRTLFQLKRRPGWLRQGDSEESAPRPTG